MLARSETLDIDRLWRIAGESLGAPPFPAGDIQGDGLRVLAQAMERRAAGDPAALRVARRDLFAWMLSYLHFARDLAQHPEIADVPVERPLFIIAFGRTGSTLLHNLLALARRARTAALGDPDARAGARRPRGGGAAHRDRAPAPRAARPGGAVGAENPSDGGRGAG